MQISVGGWFDRADLVDGCDARKGPEIKLIAKRRFDRVNIVNRRGRAERNAHPCFAAGFHKGGNPAAGY